MTNHHLLTLLALSPIVLHLTWRSATEQYCMLQRGRGSYFYGTPNSLNSLNTNTISWCPFLRVLQAGMTPHSNRLKTTNIVPLRNQSLPIPYHAPEPFPLIPILLPPLPPLPLLPRTPLPPPLSDFQSLTDAELIC